MAFITASHWEMAGKFTVRYQYASIGTAKIQIQRTPNVGRTVAKPTAAHTVCGNGTAATALEMSVLEPHNPATVLGDISYSRGEKNHGHPKSVHKCWQ